MRRITLYCVKRIAAAAELRQTVVQVFLEQKTRLRHGQHVREPLLFSLLHRQAQFSVVKVQIIAIVRALDNFVIEQRFYDRICFGKPFLPRQFKGFADGNRLTALQPREQLQREKKGAVIVFMEQIHGIFFSKFSSICVNWDEIRLSRSCSPGRMRSHGAKERKNGTSSPGSLT